MDKDTIIIIGGVVNGITCACNFGAWQNSLNAGLFIFSLLGAIYFIAHVFERNP